MRMRRFEKVKEFLIKKISEMDSAELAEFLFDNTSDYRDFVCSANDFPCRKGELDNCRDCIKLWLEKEN